MIRRALVGAACAALVGCGSGDGDRAPAPGGDVAGRLLPAYRSQIVVERLDVGGARDAFELETVAGRLVIRGTSGVAVASGLNHYLKRVGNGHLSWGGDRLDLGPALPAVDGVVRVQTAHPYRYAYNFTVHGYTTPYWDWSRWERELDLIAAHGFNHVLVGPGLEEVVVRTFTRFGYSAEELRDWIALPAHQPFQWLGNLAGVGPPLSAQLVSARATLGRRIADRMRELGIAPVVPGYYGVVPPGFAERNPGADVRGQGRWLDTYARPDLLNPAARPHFDAVADAYYSAVHGVLGATAHFAADPFHEGGDTSGIDFAAAAVAIQQAMQRAHGDAVWVIQAWLGNPRAPLLDALDPGHALVVDLWGDEVPSYPVTAGAGAAFHGVPWVWSIIQNFGGRSGLNGNLAVIAQQYGAGGAFTDARRGRLTGLGATMEALEQNPVVLDLLAEMIWRQPADGALDIEQWIRDYADRRYGTPLEAARRAWSTLLQTAYATTPGAPQGPIESIVCARPGLEVARTSGFGPGRGPFYDPALLERALGDLLAARTVLAGVDPYAFDVVDLTRQVLANRARVLLAEIRQAVAADDAATVDALANAFLALIEDQDRLLATRPELLLGRWLQAARGWGATAAEADALEHNARMILTTWSEDDSVLRDYAHREWAGLLGDYYYRRWRAFFDALVAGRADPDFFAIESAWVREADPDGSAYPVEPHGDAVDVAVELYQKYVILIPSP